MLLAEKNGFWPLPFGFWALLFGLGLDLGFLCFGLCERWAVNNPNGVASQSPGLPLWATLGTSAPIIATPTGLRHQMRLANPRDERRRNPVGEKDGTFIPREVLEM